jgi:hypothetical protein
MGLLRAGDPKGEVAATRHAKEAVRELYAHADEQTAAEWIDHLIVDMVAETWPLEVHSLGRTLKNWRDEIIAGSTRSTGESGSGSVAVRDVAAR